MKRCSKCGSQKQLSEFAKCRRNPDGLQYICRDCGKAQSAEAYARRGTEYYRNWRNEHREQVRESNRRWKAAHPERSPEDVAKRRARLHAVGYEFVDRKYIFKRDGGICHICSKRVDPKRWDLDHLIPISKGGPHNGANVRVSHPSCNARRNNGRLPAQLLLIA